MSKSKSEEIKKGEIIIYKSKDGPKLEVRLEEETIWLTQNQIASLFDVKKAAISKHLKNIFNSGELKEKATVSKMETVQIEGDRRITRDLTYYNLDMIISVGYRVNSQRATQFRIWATKTLSTHLVKGYTLNEKRLLSLRKNFNELTKTIEYLKEKSKHEMLAGQEQEILSLLSDYSKSLSLLVQFDKDKLALKKKEKEKYEINYKDAASVIKKIKEDLTVKKEAFQLFGQENGNQFKAILKNIYQTFGGIDLYPSLEEKAAHLLYFIIKDHPFNDGNKRIGSFLFIYYLDRNNFLYKKSGEKKINDNALTALALLIAISDPNEKDKMIKIITNLIF
ncbi:MAG: virulence protein RhuM/Fic/DOC family protein [Ignavibacteriaceae bacterium]|nr:virulence protein RhuM/Fic/DOC family protein [Ignavibacteriaceae bacterium]